MSKNKQLGAMYVALAVVLALIAPAAQAESPVGRRSFNPARTAVRAPRRAGRPMHGRRPISLRPFSQVAVIGKVGLLGIGVELATPLGRHFNFRAGSNFFHYTDNLTQSGVHYQARLSFTSAEASFDWYPWGRSFHISPGALIYENSSVFAHGEVPGGDSFTVNGTNYVSSPMDPVRGSAQIQLARCAPILTIGWGNPIPRSGRHFSFPFEVGFVYMGDPMVNLNFAGTACNASGQGCEQVTKDSTFQSNVNADRVKLQKDANYARFYPVISIGYSYRF